MSRLASDAKMGYYPTPSHSLKPITDYIGGWTGELHAIDPCCGEGAALRRAVYYHRKATTWGIEADIGRAAAASDELTHVAQGSIYDARVNPLGCMGLLWLNPPYMFENGERAEMTFLKHSIKWLAPEGLLVLIVPEHVLSERNRLWIGERFVSIKVFRLHRVDFPAFSQVVLFGVKRNQRAETAEAIPPPPYGHIEDVRVGEKDVYIVPPTAGPSVFQSAETVTDDEIARNAVNVIQQIDTRVMGRRPEGLKAISPLFPLRKGHLVSLLTAGLVEGKIDTPDGYIVVKGYSDRVQHTRVEDDKEITTDTYSVGIRVLSKEGWFDVR